MSANNLRSLCKLPTLRLVAALRNGPMSFADLYENLAARDCFLTREHVSKARRDGLISKLVVSIDPVKVDWHLTPLGSDFARHAGALVDWLDYHRADIAEAREAFTRREAAPSLC